MSLNRHSSIRSFNTKGQQMTILGSTPMGPYFQAWELACHGEVDGQHIMRCHDGYILELNYLRHKFGEGMTLNSCCRTPDYNIEIEGHPRSLHLTENPVHPTSGCMASDVNINRWHRAKVNKFIAIAVVLGWSLGRGDSYNGDDITNGDDIASGFIHIDRRIDIGLAQTEFFYK